jgi:hypothetical protein
MRKLFLSLGVVLAALIAAPAAEAHHIDQAQSAIIGCALVNGTPTITGRTAYRQFEDYNKPVQTSVFANGQVVYHEWISWAGSDYDHLWSAAVAPGEYDVRYWASWAKGTVSDNVPSSGTTHVSCPAPPPPVPPVVTPPPTPPTPPAPPVPPVLCNGKPVPPGARCTPPPPPRFHCPRIHLIMPNPNTLAGRHGVHDFGGRCSHGRIVSTTLYVSPGLPPTHGSVTVRLHARGPVIHGVWLYDLTVWRHHYAWGRYRLRFVFRVRFHGHVYTCVRVAHFLNHDPHGLPS